MSRVYRIALVLIFPVMLGMIIPLQQLIYAIPPLEQFAFQGVLKDNSGNLITGTRSIGLRLYTVYSGHTATNDATCLKPFCLWTENHTNVAVSSGIFAITAGNINSLTKAINFTNALYLEVIIRNSTAGDQVLTPRLNITATPFSFAAEKASTDLNLNKKQIINASNIYASGVINGIIINNSTQAVSGISTLMTTGAITSGGSLYTVASGTVNGITINNSTQAVSGISSLQIQKGSSIISSINSAGVVNGSSVQAAQGSSIMGSISNSGIVNGSSLQIENGPSHTNIVTITSTGGITISGANINLGTNFLTNSGHQIGLPLNSGTVLLTNGTLSSLTGNLNSVGGTFTGTVNTATAITAPTSTNTINGIIINGGAISGVSTLITTSTITAGNGLTISAGHLSISGSAPTLTSCGAGPTISGTDNAGLVTPKTATCTINFHSAWTSPPACFVADLTNDFDPTGYTPTTTTLSLSGLTASDKLMYICMGQ